jgi:LPS export ABC transporter permease LptG
VAHASFQLSLMDRYIGKRLVNTFFLGIILFTLVLFFSDALLDFMRDLQHYGISWDLSFTLVGLQLPRIVAMVIPMSALLATLMTYNGFNNQFELIAMRMSGLSLARLMQPALILGVFACVVTYGLNDYVVPLCNTLTRGLKTYAVSEQNLPAVQDNFTFKQFDQNQALQRLLYISHFKENTLGQSTLLDLTNPGALQVVQARSGQWQHHGITLTDANVYTVSANEKLTNTTYASSLQLQNFLTPAPPKNEVGLNENSFFKLAQIIQEKVLKGQEVSIPLWIRLWEKITIPLTALPLVLIAVPLAMTPPRKLTNRGVLFSILILFSYYLLKHIGVQLAEHGWIPPLLGALLPLLVLSALAGRLFIRKNKVL